MQNILRVWAANIEMSFAWTEHLQVVNVLFNMICLFLSVCSWEYTGEFRDLIVLDQGVPPTGVL